MAKPRKKQVEEQPLENEVLIEETTKEISVVRKDPAQAMEILELKQEINELKENIMKLIKLIQRIQEQQKNGFESQPASNIDKATVQVKAASHVKYNEIPAFMKGADVEYSPSLNPQPFQRQQGMQDPYGAQGYQPPAWWTHQPVQSQQAWGYQPPYPNARPMWQ